MSGLDELKLKCLEWLKIPESCGEPVITTPVHSVEEIEARKEALVLVTQMLEFPKVVAYAFEALGNGLTARLANHFEAAPSTVKRWANATARPHPRLKKQIIEYILDYCETLPS